MKYYIFTLKFLTPVHFGDTSNGGNLEKVTMNCPADTFFSALCNEAASKSQNLVENMIDKFTKGDICISSLMPYYIADKGELELYLPKPFYLGNGKEQEQSIKNFKEMKNDATKLKKNKKLSWVRASEIGKFLRQSSENTVYEFQNPVFAVKLTSAKVNCRMAEPLPYFVGSYIFSENSGLYFILGLKHEDDIECMSELVASLGYAGIGGKRSSGYGKYELADDYFEIMPEDGVYLDGEIIARMLADDKSSVQMCVAPLHPRADEITKIKQGQYKLINRGGFIGDNTLVQNVKRSNVYMITEGSCFPERVNGNVVAQTIEGVPHRVYRNGKGMFMGLNYD